MADDREDTLWGYATGSGEFIGSDAGDVSLDMIDTIAYDGPNGEAVWIGDGGWKTVNYTRSDEDIIEGIKKLKDD